MNWIYLLVLWVLVQLSSVCGWSPTDLKSIATRLNSLDVHKTAAKEFGSAYPSGQWFSNPASRWYTEPWSIFWHSSCPKNTLLMLVDRAIFNWGSHELCVDRCRLVCWCAAESADAFMSCRLDYCRSLMAGLPLCDVKRLQMVQNAAHVSSAACQDETMFCQCFSMNYIDCKLCKGLTFKLW